MTPEQAQKLVGREFVHFKGNRYRLVAIAKHSETLEPVVVYRALYGEGGVWVRPFAMFFGDVDRDGYRGPRFRLAEAALRFLTDYLKGDVYFHTAYEGHNLVRCRTQLRMVESMEAQKAEYERIVRGC